MIITNKLGLPKLIEDFLMADFYDGAGDSISCTSLLKPTQELVLSKRYEDKIESDISERLWSVLGSGVHAVLEKVKSDVEIERLYATVEGQKISGKFDVIRDGSIWDYKCTSAWTIKSGSSADKWGEQLSIYRYLWWINKKEKLNPTGYIIAICRDWHESNVKEGSNYPKAPFVQIDVPLMSIKETEKFIAIKIKEYKENEKLPDGMLKPCTNEEMWYQEKKDVYMKCDKYCSARQFCQQKIQREKLSKEIK